MLNRLACFALVLSVSLVHALTVARGKALNIGRYLKGEAKQNIPKIIHQTWKDSKLPPEFEKWSRSWKECLPDWEYKLHTDEDNRNLIKDHFPEFLETYDNYDTPIKRVDAARYAYMSIDGGLYADLDIECVRDPKQLIDVSTDGNADLTLACEKFSNDGQISNAWMLSTSDKGRAFFRRAFARLPQAALLDTCWATGPQFLTKLVEDFLLDEAVIQDAEDRARVANFRPDYGAVKSLRKRDTNIAVADDALLFNIPWYALDMKQYCMDSDWCRQRYPYAISVSHWSSSWIPEMNTLSTEDFIRTYALDDKKCSTEDTDRSFKIDASALPDEVDMLDLCGKACRADPECNFFSLFPRMWCIGCKGQPVEGHDGFLTYQMTGRKGVAQDPAEFVNSDESPSEPGQQLTRMYSLDGKMCATEGSNQVFRIEDFPLDMDQLDYCSRACDYNPDCNFFSLLEGKFCMGCDVEPTTSHMDPSVRTYKLQGEGGTAAEMPQESAFFIHAHRDPSASAVFARTFTSDNKKCAEGGDRLFKIDGTEGELEQVYACGKACDGNSECKFFSVHVLSRWCIGCRTQPSEEAEGFWAYELTTNPKSMISGTGAIAPLIQSGEYRNSKRRQMCTCLIKGMSGTPTVMCQQLLRQQMGPSHSRGPSAREGFRKLLDLHMRWC